MNRPRVTVAELREAVARVDAMPMKERRKAARSLGGMALELEGADVLTTRDDIELAIKALAMGAAAHSYPQRYQLARARLAQQRRQSFGLPEPVVAFETVKTLDVEFGGLLIDDVSRDPAEALNASPIVAYLNRVGAYFISLGGDGAIKVRLRVHESGPTEPLSDELRRLREATAIGALKCESGQMNVFGGGQRTLLFDLPIGGWEIVSFGLGMGRRPECLLIVSPGNNAAPPLKETPELMI